MPYLIDGNNLLHAVAEHGPGPAPGREALCRLVARWARRHGVKVTLVFDGPAPRTDLAKQFQHPGVTVRFSGSDSADTVIEDEVARAATPADITVVTTDRAIQHEVRYRRAATIDSEAFISRLFAEPPAERPGPTPAPEKPDQVAPGEADQWLNRFADELDDLPDPWP